MQIFISHDASVEWENMVTMKLMTQENTRWRILKIEKEEAFDHCEEPSIYDRLPAIIHSSLDVYNMALVERMDLASSARMKKVVFYDGYGGNGNVGVATCNRKDVELDRVQAWIPSYLRDAMPYIMPGYKGAY